MLENRGSLDLRVNGASFLPGQTVTGTVALNLTKPIKARALRVAFYGTVSRGKRHSPRRIFHIVQIVSGEKIYSPGESYAFQLPISPPLEFQQPEGTLGDIMAAGSTGLVQPRGWYVHATLDIPIAFDLNTIVQIAIAGEMLKSVRVPGNTQQEQLALMQHNIDMNRRLSAGTALFGDPVPQAPPPRQPAQPV